MFGRYLPKPERKKSLTGRPKSLYHVITLFLLSDFGFDEVVNANKECEEHIFAPVGLTGVTYGI
jgi:hypothetical protein